MAELDGPYMAGLEGWDILTEAEYISTMPSVLLPCVRCFNPGALCSCSVIPKVALKSNRGRTEQKLFIVAAGLHGTNKLQRTKAQG